MQILSGIVRLHVEIITKLYMVSGSSVGAALTYPMCGYIIDRWGWELVFYVSGVLGVAWFTAWWMVVYDSPAEHPRISLHERDYIITSLGGSVAKKQVKHKPATDRIILFK